MPSSRLKFLLDENVKVELYKFLKKKGVDVLLVPKGCSNGKVKKISLAEKRAVITNDEDFSKMTDKEVFGVVWLKIPQNSPYLLIASFSKLLDSKELNLKGRLIILWPNRFDNFPLEKKIQSKKVDKR